MINKSDRILITGGTGLIGSNLTIRLNNEGYETLSIGSEKDLRVKDNCEDIFKKFKPNIVFHLAAKVGGIHANSNFKADFYSDNILINTNIVNECYKNEIQYVFAMGTGCAYPKRLEDKLLKEDYFLDGIPEVTNDAYAYAKRCLLVHLKAINEATKLKYVYALPSNIYGKYDNFHPLNSHVIPGLIRRFCYSTDNNLKDLEIWGDGTAKRDFMYIDDCIEAIITLAKSEFIGTCNIATGKLVSIKNLSFLLKEISGFQGNLLFNNKKPAGQMQRIMDTSIISSLGWDDKVSLKDGLQKTINWYRENKKLVKER